MVDLLFKWAPAHDNTAGYVPMVVFPQVIGPLYPVYVTAADGTVKAKGTLLATLEMNKVQLAQYVQMREADLGFSGEDDVSKEITVTIPNSDRTAMVDYNATIVHRFGTDDARYSGEEQLFPRVTWLLKMLEVIP